MSKGKRVTVIVGTALSILVGVIVSFPGMVVTPRSTVPFRCISIVYTRASMLSPADKPAFLVATAQSLR